MFARARSRLTYANVTATLALFIALGGTGYAALSLPRNSVGAKQIRAGAVTKTKLATGAVSSAKLRRGAVTGSRVAGNTLTGKNISERTLEAVPKAIRAFTADKAARADSAAVSDTLQGATAAQLRDRCPTSTLYDAGGCIEAATRAPATYENAAIDCPAGRRLPSVSELLAFTQGHGGAGPELTSDLQAITTAFTVNTSNHNVGTVDTITTALPFRCVALPLNADPGIPGG